MKVKELSKILENMPKNASIVIINTDIINTGMYLATSISLNEDTNILEIESDYRTKLE